VKSSHIEVTGKIPGLDEQAFTAAARAAGEGCPISGALKGNVELSVDATLG
jgi:lipoyl-dependent peroxiredoxin